MLPTQKIESILFITNKPLSAKKLAELTSASDGDVEHAIALLQEKYNAPESGIRLLKNGTNVQLATAPDSAEVVEEFLKSELTGDITKPQLETLTIIAYRGPILKSELEQIRGVNCSLILRNLQIRGLVEMTSSEKDKQSQYQITMDFMRFLGIDSVSDLPDYERLSRHENIEAILESASAQEPITK